MKFSGNLLFSDSDLWNMSPFIKKNRRIIIYLLTGIIAVSAITGIVMWNKPHKNVRDAAALQVSAAELYSKFINDTIIANLLYRDKVVQISGKVQKLFLNQLSQQVILVKTPIPDAFINCTMDATKNGLAPGDSIAIKGICVGYIGGDIDLGLPGDVFITRCYFINKF